MAHLNEVSISPQAEVLVAKADLVQRREEAPTTVTSTQYRLLLESSTDVAIVITRDGYQVDVSPSCKAMTGFTPQEMMAMRLSESVHPDDSRRVLDLIANEVGPITYRILRKDGRYVWVETTCKSVGGPCSDGLLLAIVRDVDERVRDEMIVRESEKQYRVIAENSTDMVFQLDRDLVRRYVSPACRELLGFTPEELVGINPVSMVHPGDARRLTLALQALINGRSDRRSIVKRIRHRNGKWIWVESQFRALKDTETGQTIGIIGAVRDMSIRKAIEEELAEAHRRLHLLAEQDGLTGLANRRVFDEVMGKEHQRAGRDKQMLGLIMIDVDLFKTFNDNYGHPAGDDCLRQVSLAITENIRRAGDIAARYGGEEFAVVLPNTDEQGAEVIAEKIRCSILHLGIVHNANALEMVTVSAGVASIDCSDVALDVLLENADKALYRAKASGRNAVVRATRAAAGRVANQIDTHNQCRGR